MADCASLLDEELSSFVFNYLTENSGSQVSHAPFLIEQKRGCFSPGVFLHVTVCGAIYLHHFIDAVRASQPASGVPDVCASRGVHRKLCIDAKSDL